MQVPIGEGLTIRKKNLRMKKKRDNECNLIVHLIFVCTSAGQFTQLQYVQLTRTLSQNRKFA